MTSKDHYNKAAHQKLLIFGFLFTWPHSNTATSRYFTTNLKNIILVCGHVEEEEEEDKAPFEKSYDSMERYFSPPNTL